MTQSHEFAQSCITTSQRTSPQQYYRDATEDTKNSDWRVSSFSVSNVSKDSTLNDQMVFPVDQKKPETTASYRLFGIDLMSPPLAASEEKTAPMRPINITKPTLESNSDPKSEISKASEEKKQEPAQASPKEVQSKQSSSTRSRTKVSNEHLLCTYKGIRLILHSEKCIYISVIRKFQIKHRVLIMFTR